jgi:flagellar M-ring protein FliF
MMSLLQSMSTRGKLLLGGSIAGVAVLAFMLVSLATKPTYTTLAAGMDPAQTGKITSALDAQGITNQLANGGTAIQVTSADISRARVALASAGLSATGAGSDGWAQFDKQKLGSSNFQQQVAYQRALEAQIGQTIGQVDGVSGATVQLTMPQEQLFADQQQPATASVLLGGGPSTLDPGAVRGIANLVASAVPNLKTSNVTITDGSGQLMWPTADSANGGAVSKPAAEARYNQQLGAQLNAIVAQTVGPGKGEVRVHSDLNVDATTRDQLQYAKTGTPIKTTKDSEKLKGTGGGASGAAGTASNVPTYAAAAGGAGGNSNYQRTQGSTEFGVGKVVTHTKVAPGAVNRLNVALVLDPSIPPATRKQLQAAIAQAAGVNTQRGDQIVTSVVPFAKLPAAAAAAGPVANILGYAKYAGAGLASLLFLFFMRRALRKRESADLIGEPVWLNQIESPRPVGELSAGGAGALGEGHEPMLTSHPNRRRQQVEQAVQREPERVVQALRAWMAEDEVAPS